MVNLPDRWSELWLHGMGEVWRHYTAAQNMLLAEGQRMVGQTPAQIIHTEGHVRVLHYTPRVDIPCATPVLCIPSLINRYYVMDLVPERSLIRAMLEHGLNMYMLDWGTATDADRHMTLDETITGLLHRAVLAVQHHAGQSAVSLLGYCMGGMIAAVYAVLFPGRVANLVNLAGPFNYHDDGIYSVWTRPQWFDADLLVDTLGNIPAQLLNSTFQAVRPTERFVQALNYWENRHDVAFVQRFAAMQLWLNDPTPFPGEVFRKYIKDLYQANKLLLGTFEIGDRRIDLGTINIPVLTIAARHDHIAPWQSVIVFNDLITSDDKQAIIIERGHIGMVIGSNAPRELWPQLGTWLVQRSGTLGKDFKSAQ